MLRVSIYLGDPFPKEPSTSSGRSFSNYCRRPGFADVLSQGLTALGPVRSNINRESQLSHRRHSSISESIPVYSPRVTVSRWIEKSSNVHFGRKSKRGRREGRIFSFTTKFPLKPHSACALFACELTGRSAI